MRLELKNYINEFKKNLSLVEASDSSGKKINIANAVDKAIGEICSMKDKDAKVIIIGNGGSASIANHMAIDLWKNVGIKAMSFSDSAMLTCVSNDFGFERVFEKPIEMFADAGDMLIAISSSGKSKNILRAAFAAKKKNCIVFTLSGFRPDNPLRLCGKINLYAPFTSYGYVELAHSILCHFIVDKIMHKNSHG